MQARDVFAVFGSRGAGRPSKDVGTPVDPAHRRGIGALAPARSRRPALLAALAVLASLVLGVSFAGAELPVVSVESEQVEYTTATIKGTVDPKDHGTSFHFEYATQAQFEASEWGEASSAGFGFVETGEPPAQPSEALAGLAPDTIYHLRLVAENVEGELAEAIAPNFTTKPVTKPAVSGLAATESSFSGFVNPDAPKAAAELEGGSPEEEAINGAYATHWWFTCEPGCSFAGTSEGDLGADNTAHSVPPSPAEPTDLEPSTTYDVILHATNAGGEDSEALVGAITTGAVKPDIESETLWEPTRTSIQLNALVNDHNSALSDCHFQYGTTAFVHTAPCVDPHRTFDTFPPPADNSFHMVAARLIGLSPATTYRFRLLATNAAGTTAQVSRTFTTPSPPAAPGECPNQAIREAQGSTFLPECRAYEKVSPSEKGHGDIVGFGETNVASADGDAVTFDSYTPFGDATGSSAVGQTQYVARRGPDGWSSHAITPLARYDANQVFTGSTHYMVFSDDLRRAVVVGYDLPAAAGGVPHRFNLYSEDTTTNALRTVTVSQDGFPDPLPKFIEMNTVTDWGVSADARHIAFTSYAPYLPEAVSNGLFGPPNAYQWNDGVLTLAGRLPDGTVPARGSEIRVSRADALSRTNYRDAMSDDGSRLLFFASQGGQSQLFQRIDGAETVWVSEPEIDPSEPNPPPGYQPEPAAVQLEMATPDGRNVFFYTRSALLPGDRDEDLDLYRWTAGPEPASERNLTLISDQVPPDAEQDVFGAADDGDVVYYKGGGGPQLLVWARGVTHRVTGALEGARGQNGVQADGAAAVAPGLSRVSTDGRYVVFSGFNGGEFTRSLTGAPIEVEGTNAPSQLYLYDLDQETLKCLSCATDGATRYQPSVIPEANQAIVGMDFVTVRPRYLSSSGKVFFSTVQPLLAADTNNASDTYEYDPTTASFRLLTAGTGHEPATFAAADTNGDDVFLATRDQLVPGDQDNLIDLYDARVGGGRLEPMAPPTSPPCQGEACQGAAAASPAAATLASRAARPGNPHRAPCRRSRPHRKAHPRAATGCPRRHHRRRARHHRHGHHRLGHARSYRGGAARHRARLDREAAR